MYGAPRGRGRPRRSPSPRRRRSPSPRRRRSPSPRRRMSSPRRASPNRSGRRRSPSPSAGESASRRHLERRYGDEFPTVRPDWLQNPRTGSNLELDGYNAQRKIAFEYHGRQHYEYVPHFHGDRRAFEEQRQRDALKRRRCKANGVTLVEVPDDVPVDEIGDFIDDELRAAGRRGPYQRRSNS